VSVGLAVLSTAVRVDGVRRVHGVPTRNSAQIIVSIFYILT